MNVYIYRVTPPNTKSLAGNLSIYVSTYQALVCLPNK